MGKTSHDLLDLLHDPTFQHLYQRSDNEIMNWSKFRLLPMPAGYETEEVWGVIEALRRLKSHRFPYRPYTHAEQPAETWCSLTNHIGALLREIVVTAHENASEQIRGGQYRFLDILSTDLSAALERDGISLPPEVIHSLATRQRQAASHDEHVAAEAIALLLEIDRYARYPISPWMIEDVLSHFGAETSQLHRAEDAVCQLAFAYNTEPPERIIDTLLQTMNARCLEPELYLLNLLATSTIIWDLLPFCAYNGLLELFIRHWALESRELSHIRLVPYGYLCLQWEHGDATIVEAAGDYFDVNPIMGEDHDATPNFGHELQLIANWLSTANQGVEPRMPEEIKHLLETHDELNGRQRDTLASLAADPTSQTTVKLHMNLYRVSYGTARTDLLDLAEKGLLVQDYQSRAMVFRTPTST